MAGFSPDAGRGEPLRLLWLIDSLTMGGAESLVPVFARALDARRVHLSVCCLKAIAGNPVEAELRAQGVPVVNLGARHLRDLAALVRLIRLMRRQRVQLVHAHLTYAAIWGALAARLAGARCVATLHTPPVADPWWHRHGLRERLLWQALARGAARVILVSQALRDAYRARTPLADARLTVVHNGVDVAAFAGQPVDRRCATRAALGIGPEAAVVTTVSVLREGKGVEVFLTAIPAILAALGRDVVFAVVGDGPQRATLEAVARAAGIDGRVRWLGLRRDVPDLLAASDLFVLPTRGDAFPTVLLEAMAAGLPSVASRVGGVPEILVEDTGLLVEPGNPTALASAVIRVLTDPALATALGEQARRRAADVFSASAWVRRLEAVYADVLGPSSSEARR